MLCAAATDTSKTLYIDRTDDTSGRGDISVAFREHHRVQHNQLVSQLPASYVQVQR